MKWGIVSTIKAPARDVLNFVAYHLDLGADQLFIYLDAPNPVAVQALKFHPKVRVTVCTQAHWKERNGWRPKKHQVRQLFNATHAYQRAQKLEWLAHIDVDEFIFPSNYLRGTLNNIPTNIPTARMRPIEALAGAQDLYKALMPSGQNRNDVVDTLYPEFGRYLKGGFLSHTGGKIFLRTSLPELKFGIHFASRGDDRVTETSELRDVSLCHRHVTSWENWRAHFDYRHKKGSYRADLTPARVAETASTNLHQMLTNLITEEGEDGLKRFFDEVCAATPEHLEKLKAQNLLRHCPLDLDAKRAKHFPEHADIVA
ncbi:MAG: glycosyltransferase family 2 protein [Arenibacterium sp.]